jgi:hypothetical protein
MPPATVLQNKTEGPPGMSDTKPDPHYYPKQFRGPRPPAPIPAHSVRAPIRARKPRRPLWKHPMYLALWERLPNGLQIRLLEYEARLEMRQERRAER